MRRAHDARGSGGGAALTHLDAEGRARMVDVGAKPETPREAVASGELRMRPRALDLLRPGANPKGEVLNTAVVAGTLAAKRVDELVPLCHTVALDAVEVRFEVLRDRVLVRTTARARGRTGVEMEALTAASVALLTVYDMCKSADKGMVLGPVRLERKSGGRSGTYVRADSRSPWR